MKNFNKMEIKCKIVVIIAIIICIITTYISIVEREFLLTCVSFLLACNIAQFFCVDSLSQKLNESSDKYHTLIELYNAELKYNLSLKRELSELKEKNTVKKLNTKKSTSKKTTKKKKEEK